MSYVITDQQPSSPRPPRRRWPWVLAAVLALALVATGAFVLGRGAGSDQTAPAAPAARPPSAPTGPLGTVSWQRIAGSPVPRSVEHGPRQDVGGVASGYSHDEAGAVLAAINISVRLSSAAGPGVYDAVLENQTTGDTKLTRDQLAAQSSTSSPEESAAQQWWYRIRSGDPRGDLVEVSLLARTPQASAMGGYARIDRVLSWRNGDWAVQVPPSPVSLATSTAGYTPIGGGQ